MQGKRSYNKKTKKIVKVNNKTRYLVLLVLITFIMLGGILFARSKYALKSNTIQTLKSNSFYFNSYSLSETEKEYNISGNSIEFKILNYEDELRTSDTNIKYKIETEILSSTNSNITLNTYIDNEENNTGVLNSGEKIEKIVKIQVSGASSTDNIKLRVRAIAQSPYSKTISAVYNIKPVSNQANYDINLINEKDYVNLIIRTYSFSGTRKIQFDKTKVKPYDEKKAKIDEDFITVDLKSNSNYSFKFIKLTSDEINLEQFEVIQ